MNPFVVFPGSIRSHGFDETQAIRGVIQNRKQAADLTVYDLIVDDGLIDESVKSKFVTDCFSLDGTADDVGHTERAQSLTCTSSPAVEIVQLPQALKGTQKVQGDKE